METEFSLRIRKFLTNRWFVGVLLVKILAAFLFANDVLSKGFAPFVNYFVESGFHNPYEFFFHEGLFKAFPYSTVMLWILAVPRVLFDHFLPNIWHVVTPLNLFITRLPVLAADVVMYLILCFWLPAREKQVVVFYWASPMLFYINYFHGQLDAIPTTLLIGSLVALFNKRERLAFVLLGVGIAAKTHLLAALPFYFVYLYVKKFPARRIVEFQLTTIGTAVVLLLPYFFSQGYQHLVLRAEEQGWIFLLQFPYVQKDVALLLAPAVYLVLFFRFASYQKMTSDLLIVILGVMFALLVVMVPPRPGWYYWSLPFLAYFYIKKREAPALNFWLLNLFFLTFFLFKQDSDLFQAFQIIAPSIASLPTPFAFFEARGMDAQLTANVLFTALQAAVVMNVVWCYKVGVRDSFEYRPEVKPLLVGIGGDSGAGKSTLANLLAKLFHEKRVAVVKGDDAHRWPRGHENWRTFTHLNPKSNRLHQDLKHTIALKLGNPVERVHYDHVKGAFTHPERVDPRSVVLFDGLHPYFIKRARDLFDVKIFVDPEEDLRVHWKILRDNLERGYEPERVLAEIQRRKDDALQFIQPQKEFADIIITYEFQERPKQLGSTDAPATIQLRISSENFLDVDPFVEEMQKVPTVKIDSTYDSLDRITIIWSGDIATKEIERIAYALIPNLRELTHTNPRWESGMNGAIQLFFLYYLSELSRQKEYDFYISSQ